MAASRDRQSDKLLTPSFPKTRYSLWDKTSMGQSVLLHINYYRDPRVCIPEKIIKLVQHQCENYGQSKHVLIGTLVIDEDGEGVQIQVDRLDTRLDIPASSLDLAVGNVIICLHVTNKTVNGRAASVDDYVHALMHLQSRCCSRESIDLCGFLHLYGWGSFYSDAHTSLVHLDFDMITLGTVFKVNPVTPVPIALTALSKNMASTRSLSNLQGTPKTGYLTMDQTRKLLLVLESDPKASVLSIVGIWVSGVEFIHHPFVWAACLRYVHSTHLQYRVCIPLEGFLLVLYTPVHSRPEFYQCQIDSGNSCPRFQLNSGHEVLNMDKVLTSSGSAAVIEVNLESVCADNKKEIFNDAQVKLGTCVDVKDVSGQEDLEPRSAPTPHSEKVPVFHPVVPDVSVLWTEPLDNILCHELPHGRSSKDPEGLTTTLEMSSRSEFTARIKSPHPNLASSTKELQHVKYHPQLQTRPLLSQHYSPFEPTDQGFPLSSSQPHQPVLRTQSGQWLPTSSHYTSNFNQTSTTNAAESCCLRSPVMPHPSQLTSSLPVGHSSKVSLRDSTEGSGLHDSHQQVGTPTFIHTQSYGHPFREAGDRSCQILYEDNRINSRIVQHTNYPQSAMTLASSSGQCQDVVPLTVSLAISNNLPSNPAVTSSRRDCLPQRTTLKTIMEEISSSHPSSLQKSGHHLEQESTSANILENGELQCKESTGSPLKRPSTNISGRSTGEDSGLGVTPHRLSTSAPELGTASFDPTISLPLAPMFTDSPSGNVTQSHTENIQWEQIPPEIRTLFFQQSEQLKQLQQQVQILQSQLLAQSKQVSSQHLVTSNQKHCSVTASTTYWNDQNKLGDCISAQVKSPATMMQQEGLISTVTSSTKTDMANTVSSSLEGCGHCKAVPADGSCDKVVPADGNCDKAVSNIGYVAERSPDSFLEDVNQGDLDTAMTGIHLFKQTASIDLSDLAVDIPEYTSSINDRNHAEENPSSDYYRQTEEDLNSTVGEDAADPKLYYSQLMKNIQMFLTNSGSENSRTTVNQPEPHLQMFLTNSESEDSRTTVNQPEPHLQMSTSRTESPACSVIFPEVSSVSMLLGYGSDPCQSMEINALAMKYLSDEQLTHMAKLRQLAPHRSAYSANILQQVIKNSVTPEVSRLGMSPNDLTLGTQMYLEKHGLLGSDGSILERPMLGHGLQLRTDFSIWTSESAASKTSFNLNTSIDEPHHHVEESPQQSSMSHLSLMESVTSVVPAVTPETVDHMNNENWLPENRRTTGVHKNSGIPPIFPSSKNSTKNRMLIGSAVQGQYNVRNNTYKQNVLQEVKPQVLINKKMRSNHLLNEDSKNEEAEEDNLLDIEILKQMPKLL